MKMSDNSKSKTLRYKNTSRLSFVLVFVADCEHKIWIKKYQ